MFQASHMFIYNKTYTSTQKKAKSSKNESCVAYDELSRLEVHPQCLSKLYIHLKIPMPGESLYFCTVEYT